MRLQSALEDFEANTLGAVSGSLSRLSYVGRLHDGNGTYGHWGLSKVYGGGDAQRAIRTSHRGLLSEVLKKPLAALLNELAICSSELRWGNPHLSPLPPPPGHISGQC
jgi:hypothetical protein